MKATSHRFNKEAESDFIMERITLYRSVVQIPHTSELIFYNYM